MNVKFRAMVPSDMYYFKQRLDFAASEDMRGLVAYDMDTAKTLAIFVMHDWTATSASVHQVIFNTLVLRHKWLEEVAHFMFDIAARLKVYGLVPDNNVKALSMNEKIGFEEVARLEDAVDIGVDYIVMELRRENCRYWVSEQRKVA